MTRRLCALFIVLFCAAATVAAAADPSVLIRTAPLRRQPLETTLAAYGTVGFTPSLLRHLTLPGDGRIETLRVTAGEVVRAGEPLFVYAPAPQSAAAYQKAALAVRSAATALEHTRALATHKLATRDQVAAAEETLGAARAELDAARRSGGAGPRTVSAPGKGIVTDVSAHPGDRLPAGAAVLDLAPADSTEVVLGIEPEDAARVKTGMIVHLRSVFDGRLAFNGRIRTVRRIINPKTRLLDVVIAFPGALRTPLPAGLSVQGEIVLASGDDWVVPRSAVLSDAKGAYLFQVENGRARRLNVITGTATDAVVAVKGSFDPKAPVVTEGNYELMDGMAVREKAQ